MSEAIDPSAPGVGGGGVRGGIGVARVRVCASWANTQVVDRINTLQIDAERTQHDYISKSTFTPSLHHFDRYIFSVCNIKMTLLKYGHYEYTVMFTVYFLTCYITF